MKKNISLQRIYYSIIFIFLSSFSFSQAFEPMKFYIKEASAATGSWSTQVAQALKEYTQKGFAGLAQDLISYQKLSPEELAKTNPQAVSTLMLALANYNLLNKLTSKEFNLNNLENAHAFDLLARTSLEAGILAAASYTKHQLAGKVLKTEKNLSKAIDKYIRRVFDYLKNNNLTKEKAEYAQELLALATKELKTAMPYSNAQFPKEDAAIIT